VLDAHIEDPPPKVTATRPELPATIDEVIARGMAKDPGSRYARAMELLDAARSALDEVGRGAPPVDAAQGRLRLLVIEGVGLGAQIEVGADELVFGRQSEGDGRLAGDAEISRRHARIWRTNAGEFMVEDLGSTNGTLVSGRVVEAPRPLAIGDTVALGATTLLVEALAGEADQRPPAAAAAPVGEIADAARREPIAAGAGSGVFARRGGAADEARRIAIRLELDFGGGGGRLVVGEPGTELRLVERDGRWTAEPR
jgi:hypothetical protein